MMQDHDSDLADEPMKMPGQKSSAAVAVRVKVGGNASDTGCYRGSGVASWLEVRIQMQDTCRCFVMRGWGSSARRRSRPKRAPNAGPSQAPCGIEVISEVKTCTIAAQCQCMSRSQTDPLNLCF